MASKHTTSIVDISEIEDDEAPLTSPPAPPAQLAEHPPRPLPANGASRPVSFPPAGGPGRHHNQQQHHHQQHHHNHHAQFYLYNEDVNPQQRIPNLLSTMVGPSAASSPQAVSPNPPAGELSPMAGGHAHPGSHHQYHGDTQHNYHQQQMQAIDYRPASARGDTPNWRVADEGGHAGDRPTTPGVAAPPATPAPMPKANLGTLSGVYFPCVQNIFGVILFIRMVWIVGTAGVPTAFSLVFICCSVTLTTSISLSAIATNGIVPAGGPYFMISRSLGPECGGAVGTMFFLGTTVAGAMYITGAVEIMLNYLCPSWGLFGDFQRDVSIMYHNIRVYGTILLIIVGLMVWIGVKFVSKLAPIALFCVLLSIFSIYAGIFINYNGRPDLMICVVGDRLVTLKHLPYDDPHGNGTGTGSGSFEPAFADQSSNPYYQRANTHQSSSSSNISRHLSAAEQATLYQLRRTKALCTLDKLRHVFCPSEPAQSGATGTRAGFAGRGQYVGEPSDGYPSAELSGLGASSLDQTGSDPTSGGVPAAPELSEAQAMAELFKRAPNMSNCDPYFHQNRNRIHLEKAVPGIASGVLFENLRPRFRTKRTIVSYDEGTNTNERNNFNWVFVDITTSFTILISIYFPSCTGILAGSNRSGDLTDAQKSIPRGTITAQLTTSFVYLSCIVLFGSTFNNLFIRDKFGESMGGQLAVTQIAWPHPYVILIGGLLSTLGASLQSLVGAPRVLQGIAKDEVIPCFNRFAKLSPRGEPETAIIFTLCLSWFAVLIGNLDFIAPILTLSLVMCYFFINLACAVHSLLGSPNWRPRFKHYHWSISVLGCLLCLFVMIVSSLLYFLVAIFIAGCIYKYIEFAGAEKEWGDGKQGLALSAARYNLLRLKTSEPHTKNWRPQLLLFCKLKPVHELEPPSAQASRHHSGGRGGGGPHLALTGSGVENPASQQTPSAAPADAHAQLRVAHPKLLTFASQLKAGKGLTLVSSVIEGDFKQLAPLAARARLALQNSMNEEKVKGFADVLVAPSIMDGLSYQVQTAGLGGLKHNTVIVGWPEHWRRSRAPPKRHQDHATSGAASNNNNANAQQQQTGSSDNNNTSSRGSFKQRNQQQQHQQQQQQQTKQQLNTRAHLFIELMRNAQMSQNALLVIKGVDSWPESCDKLGGFIDIWWIVNDGGLLMLLPHLLRQHRTWKSCQLRIFTVAQAGDNIEQMREDLTKFLYHLRIEAQVDIVEMNNAEISDYAYERTLMMEQRSEIIKRLNVNRKQSLLLEQEIDGKLMRFRIRKPSMGDFEDPSSSMSVVPQLHVSPQSPISEHLPLVEMTQPGMGSHSQGNNSADENSVGADGQPESGAQNGAQTQAMLNNLRPDETNVRRMHTALTLNEAILKRSKSAKLVIVNLPGAPKASTNEAENNYMEFVEIITDKLERVLLVQNGGREVITIHS